MGAKVGGKKGGAMADINVTPLVDVVLVLLIIFMVVTPMLSSGVDVNLPKAKTADEEKDMGQHLVVSRTGLLDLTLSFWVLVAFACIVMDRDRMRRHLAHLSETMAPKALAAGDGPPLGIRWWRIAAIAALALACATKWSAAWYVVAFLLLSLVWDVGARRTIGVVHPWRATLIRSVPSTAVLAIVIIIGLYLLSWTGWFLSDTGWGRNWAATQGPSIVPSALRSLWHYHAEAWHFHVNLDSPHAYKSNPLSWPFQTRPTSFYWKSITEGLYMQDAWMGLIKPFALGFVIVSIGCYVGLKTTGGTQGVGRSTTNAVVASSVMVIAVDFFVTRLLFTVLY